MMGEAILHRGGVPGRVPDALILFPRVRDTRPPIVLVHGIMRDVETMAEAFRPVVEAVGRTLVLPVFSRKHWPRYQRAACPARADHALLKLMTALAEEGHIASGRFALSGFSGGAQFAHRFAWAYPGRVDRLAVASAGWWTFPDAAPYPYGMGAAQEGPAAAPFWMQANLRAFLDRDIVVRVGADDRIVDDNTRSGRRIDAQQGRDRVARARAWVSALRRVARAQGLPDRIDFAELPGCGHDFSACVAAGLDTAFVPTPPLPWIEGQVA